MACEVSLGRRNVKSRGWILAETEALRAWRASGPAFRVHRAFIRQPVPQKSL